MHYLQTLTLDQLAQQADLWDDLWQRSDVRLPSKRAQGVQLWRETFAADAECLAIVVRDHDRLIAGLPLVKDTTRWPLTIYRLPSNDTVSSGDFLIDPNCDVAAATESLANHISRLSGTVAAFEGIEIQCDRWQRLIGAFQNAGRVLHVSQGHDVGVIDIHHDWEAYTRSWSRNHRSAIKRSRKKLESEGKLEVQCLRDASDSELYQVMESCYVIEDQGWKGENGTSILRTPGLREYYHQEARIMRDCGMLDLWLLKLNDQIIAFEYCHHCKATCFSHKISFDPKFDRFSPGRVLRCIQLEQYHQDPATESLDTLGLLCEAKAKWVTRTYKSSRCFVAIGGRWSNLLLHGFKSARELTASLRKAQSEPVSIKPGAASCAPSAEDVKNSAGVQTLKIPPITCSTSASAPQQSDC